MLWSGGAGSLAPVSGVSVAVIGDRRKEYVEQDSIETALAHSSARLGIPFELEWLPTDSLPGRAAERLDGADAVWSAPGSPYASLEGALEGIGFARTHGRPFLGTCAGFQHGVLEVARNVLGAQDAAHREYGGGGDLFIDELLCSLVGQTLDVAIVDPDTEALLGAAQTTETYYCRFGLDERHRDPLASAGLHVVGVDVADGSTRIMRLAGHPFFYLTLFVPHAASTPERPHALVSGFLAAAAHVVGRV